jgi:hypothetical protein
MTTDTDPRVQRFRQLLTSYASDVAEEQKAAGRSGVTLADSTDSLAELDTFVATEFAKVPCIASDPRCPCNDGDTCNYVATKKTPAFEAPHPDAHQLLGIADLMQQIADTALVPGFGPAMLANVGHYLRGLSDRVKALPVARTGPLRVAAEAVSAPVEAVPQDEPAEAIAVGDDGLHTVARLYYTGMGSRRYRRASTQDGPGEPLCFLSTAKAALARVRALHAAITPPQSGKTENEIDRLETEVARLTAELQEVLNDAVRIDHLQNSGSTVELVPMAGEHKHGFRIGGLHKTVSHDIRKAIDAAMTKEKP